MTLPPLPDQPLNNEIIKMQIGDLLDFSDGDARRAVSKVRQFTAINGIVIEREKYIVGLSV
jgi:hypothetical protein